MIKKKATTISLVTTNGPSIDTIVNPTPKLVNNGNDQPAYLGKKIKRIPEMSTKQHVDGKGNLDRVRV